MIAAPAPPDTDASPVDDEEATVTQLERLATVFVELADTLVERFDVVEFLQLLTERSVELLQVDAAGLMLSDQGGGLSLMTSTQQRTRLLELFELQVDEGPCLDCFTSGEPVVNVALAQALERWPAFAAEAASLGFGATHALPLRLRGQVIGAMNLFTVGEGRLPQETLTVGQAMADVATIGLLQERSVQEQTVLSEQLQLALHSRVVIEQAKGMLSERQGVSVPEAFELLRRHARGEGILLTAAAAQVVEGTLTSVRPR